jgi:hypothetical protein
MQRSLLILSLKTSYGETLALPLAEMEYVVSALCGPGISRLHTGQAYPQQRSAAIPRRRSRFKPQKTKPAESGLLSAIKA